MRQFGGKGIQRCAGGAKILFRCTQLQRKANPELIDIDQIRVIQSLEQQSKVGKNKKGILFQRNKGSK